MLGSCEPTASTPPSDASPPPTPPVVAARPVVPPPKVVPPPEAPPIEPPWTDEDVPRIRKYQGLVHNAAQQYDLDPNVLNAIIWHESKFHANARGPGGAAGLMQLMPSTSKAVARKLGRANKPYDPKYNVAAGAWLLHRLLEIFEGDEELALAGYALGSGAVRKRLAAGEPLPDKTQRFIRRVDEWSQAFAEAEPDLRPGRPSAMP
ncbi:MAG TPA: lytic transglycosylase domain-containing protein [Nannocystaceae bacterium]|nr:lytic transglycosylase domain-containing protein [Nannocystaceae bacterium]